MAENFQKRFRNLKSEAVYRSIKQEVQALQNEVQDYSKEAEEYKEDDQELDARFEDTTKEMEKIW